MPVPSEPPAIEIQYIGGPTTVISIAGVSFITDPTFDAAGGEYASGPVVLHKTRGPAVAANTLGKLDVALLSHDQHADNLDHAGRELLRDIPLVLTTSVAAKRLTTPSIGMQPWDTRTIATPEGRTLRITATPARHGPVGIEPFAGEVIGFVISDVDSKTDLVYVTGDTVWYDGTREVARRFQPTVVLLFAGSATTRGPFHLTMNASDAIEAVNAFKNAAIVPVHHDGWAHFAQTQDDLRNTFELLGFGSRLHRVSGDTRLRFCSPHSPDAAKSSAIRSSTTCAIAGLED